MGIFHFTMHRTQSDIVYIVCMVGVQLVFLLPLQQLVGGKENIIKLPLYLPTASGQFIRNRKGRTPIRYAHTGSWIVRIGLHFCVKREHITGAAFYLLVNLRFFRKFVYYYISQLYIRFLLGFISVYTLNKMCFGYIKIHCQQKVYFIRALNSTN